MSFNFSYAISLSTSNKIGTTPSNKQEDEVNSLRQALSNVVANGKTIRLDIAIVHPQSRTINLADLGLTSLRALLIKSDQPFGYPLNGTTWMITRSVFLDLGAPQDPNTIVSANTYTVPMTVRLENPIASSINIQILAIGT